MSDPKTTSAFPLSRGHFGDDGRMTSTDWTPGLSQYAYVAMTFRSAMLARGYSPHEGLYLAFEETDAFFAELAKRTQS